jgi:hypothetical protein
MRRADLAEAAGAFCIIGWRLTAKRTGGLANDKQNMIL